MKDFFIEKAENMYEKIKNKNKNEIIDILIEEMKDLLLDADDFCNQCGCHDRDCMCDYNYDYS